MSRYLKQFKSRSSETILLPIRYDFVYQGLLHLFSKEMLNEIKQECLLVEKIDSLAQKIKKSKDNASSFYYLILNCKW